MIVTDRAVYDAVRAYTQENGHAPTLRELCDIVGLRAVSSVRVHLLNLRRCGFVTWTDSANRTVRIVSEWRDVA